MSDSSTPAVRYNAQLLAEDMAAAGLSKDDLAAKAGVSDMTVIRFLRSEVQTPTTAKKLAKALRRSLERYVIRAADESLESRSEGGR